MRGVREGGGGVCSCEPGHVQDHVHSLNRHYFYAGLECSRCTISFSPFLCGIVHVRYNTVPHSSMPDHGQRAMASSMVTAAFATHLLQKSG